MVRLFALIFSIGLAVLMNGCQATGVSEVSPAAFSQNSSLPAPGLIAELAVGDTIEVSVEVDGRMEVSRHQVKLDQHGAVTLPLVGDVWVKGLRPDAARNAIRRAYAAYYVNEPVVMLSSVDDVDEGEFGFVTVTGRVGRPGRVKITSSAGLRLTAAIQDSGGFAGSAKRRGILVTRTDKLGKKIQVTVDYNEIGQVGNADADISLMDGDIVYVPERIF